jgi:hypothetical protein
MSYKFNASHLFLERDGQTEMVGFADDPLSPYKYVIIQRSISATKSEKDLGLDAINIQVEDESRSKYGGITAITVDDERLLISLNTDAQKKLQISGDIKISITPENPNFISVLSSLIEMCRRDEIEIVDKRSK